MSSRAYVPSGALIRALSRPQPMRCHLARRLPAQFPRGKKTKAAKSQTEPQPYIRSPEAAEKLRKELLAKQNIFKDDARMERAMRPLPDKELERDDLPVISWYEQDLDKGGPMRLVDRIATPEDRKKDKELYKMIEESYKNPNYDDAHLNRRLLDNMLKDPNFQEFTEEIKNMKEGIMSREEMEEYAKKHGADAQGSIRMATQQALEDLINDPDIGDAKPHLQAVVDKLPQVEEIDSPEFQETLQNALAKLDGNQAMKDKLAARAKEDEDLDDMDDVDPEFNEKEADAAIAEFDDPNADLDMKSPEDLHDVDKLLHQMRGVLKEFGGEDIEAELDTFLNEDPRQRELEEEDGVFNREMDPEELVEELKKLAVKKSKEPIDLNDPRNAPAELQAKVDEIMKDPRLMDKLMYIQNLIMEAKKSQADLTNIAHETAPDPYKLESSRTATLKERMEAARQDPEHSAALRRLRVDLPPPFNVSPALKSFNQAIEFAYIGANDDIRRILWRSYQKARTLPKFLQRIGDEAWDILYYSQAVTWGSNQNRQNHLRTMLADLKSVGRDGPPTHPSTLVNQGEGQHLEG